MDEDERIQIISSELGEALYIDGHLARTSQGQISATAALTALDIPHYEGATQLDNLTRWPKHIDGLEYY